MELLTFGYLILGFLLLVGGAELLVKGAARLAAQLGITPLVIGLTVVAFGTSAPETAVSVQAVIEGSGDLSVGNVVGNELGHVAFEKRNLLDDTAAQIRVIEAGHETDKVDVGRQFTVHQRHLKFVLEVADDT